MTPIGALSSPACMAARIRAQNASSIWLVRRDWFSFSSLIPIWSLATMKGGKEGISWPISGSAHDQRRAHSIHYYRWLIGTAYLMRTSIVT
jgi:hypothetical protein